jgi:hypothetical protein
MAVSIADRLPLRRALAYRHGKSIQPDTERDTQNDWDANENKALIMLISAVHSDLKLLCLSLAATLP